MPKAAVQAIRAPAKHFPCPPWTGPVQSVERKGGQGPCLFMRSSVYWGCQARPAPRNQRQLQAFLWRDHCPASGERGGGLAWTVASGSVRMGRAGEVCEWQDH